MPRRRRALIAALTIAGALGGVGFAAVRRDPDAPVRLLFTGDILLSRQVDVERRRTGGSPWDSVASLFAGANWVGGNLEGDVGSDSSCVARDRSLCFAFSNDAPSLLATAGFDALTVENNHAGDLGPDARRRTIGAVGRAGVMGVDFDRSPRFTRVGALTVGVVAITLIPDASERAQQIPSVEVEQKLRLARTLANIVVVSIHWGNELQDWPSAAQKDAAAWLVRHGADVVVGHHPHVVQRPDCVDGHPVFYSLGNHVFDQKYPETKEGLIADCRVLGDRLTCAGIRTHTRRGSAMPVVVAGVADDSGLAQCAVRLRASLVVDGWTLRPSPWTPMTADSVGVALEGWRRGVRQWETRRVDLVSLDTGLNGDGADTLLFALERHPSAMDGEVAIRPHVYALSPRGMVAKWRGTALAWPLLDAVVDQGGLCALHRGDSFVRLDPANTQTRTMRYRWNGFGFSADTSGACAVPFAGEVSR